MKKVRRKDCKPPSLRHGSVFAYNRRGEVTSATVAGQSAVYDYDFIGNFTSATVDSATTAYDANALNQYETVTEPDATLELTYTPNGELASYGPWTYAYDALSRLTEVHSNGVLVASNFYDHQGRRVRLVTQNATHTFLYDGWNVVLELVEHDGVTDRIEYYWGKDISGSLQGAGGVGGLLYLKFNGAIYVPFYDAYGNVMEYRASDGSIAASYVYDAFGRTISQTGPLADVFRFRYSTKSFERETGLYYYGKRFYSPGLRRWLNRDPLEEAGGVNLYAFCRNNGIVYYDKNGNAYFAIRGLGKILPPLKWSYLFNCPFMKAAVDIAANMANVELVHEQIFFEDNRQPSSRGWSADGYLDSESSGRYQKRDGGYDDCIMRIAMSLVDPSHYQLIWLGNRAKCNCQDYADALRRKYREIKDDPEVKCKCK